MNLQEAKAQLELLEANNSLLRFLQETETGQDVRVLIANQIFDNQIQIGYLKCLIVVETAFTPIEERIDVN